MWYFDPRTGRYHWQNGTPLFAKNSDILALVGESIDASGVVTDQLARMVSEGLLSPGDWRDLMRREVKDEYIRQYLLGRGGLEQMGFEDWGSIGGMLADQYRYLDGFFDDIVAGRLSEAQIRARARMYTRSAREGFERAHERAMLAAGMDEVRWNIDPAVENCPDCIDFSNLGWQKVEDDPFGGCVPGSGCTVCLTNCACDREYRKSKN